MELSDFCWLDSIFGSTPAAVWARPELIGVMNWSHLRMRKGISAIIEKFPFVGCKKLRRNLLSIFHFESFRLDGRDDDKTSNNSHRQRQQKLKSSTSQSDDKWTSLSLIIWRHLSISCQEINGSTNLMELNLNLSIIYEMLRDDVRRFKNSDFTFAQKDSLWPQENEAAFAELLLPLT